MPSTPSGIRYERAAEPLGGLSSEASVTSTSPATFTDSIKGGTVFYESSLARTLASSHQYCGLRVGRMQTYQQARAADQSHEVVALCNLHRFFDRH